MGFFPHSCVTIKCLQFLQNWLGTERLMPSKPAARPPTHPKRKWPSLGRRTKGGFPGVSSWELPLRASFSKSLRLALAWPSRAAFGRGRRDHRGKGGQFSRWHRVILQELCGAGLPVWPGGTTRRARGRASNARKVGEHCAKADIQPRLCHLREGKQIR